MYEENLIFDKRILNGDFYVLGICYGMQLIAKLKGGEVSHGKIREYGKTLFYPDTKEKIFDGLNKETIVWMSHWDYVSKKPEGFKIIGRSENIEISAMVDKEG